MQGSFKNYRIQTHKQANKQTQKKYTYGVIFYLLESINQVAYPWLHHPNRVSIVQMNPNLSRRVEIIIFSQTKDAKPITSLTTYYFVEVSKLSGTLIYSHSLRWRRSVMNTLRFYASVINEL